MKGADYFIQAAYLAASVLFIIGLKSLTKPDSARRGMQQAAVGMLLAIETPRTTGKIAGLAARDPAFDTPAVWIDPQARDVSLDEAHGASDDGVDLMCSEALSVVDS